MLVNSPTDFDAIEIGLASPEKIRFWSYGEIEKPETINYRTFKPERKGLFCEKIFGPVKDWECSCGKYRRVRYRGIVCERCGVEVTHSKVRRERMGHIELAAPVSHIWFLKGIPTYMGLLLDMSSRQLEEVIYYDSYIVTQVEASLEGKLEVKQTLSVSEYYQYREEYGDKFKAAMGAEAIQKILSDINLKDEVDWIRKELETASGQKRLKLTKRLRIVESLHKSGNRPEWMILQALPVMPPDLRPMVQLEGGRFATSDLNDLYRRVVNRNNRLKRLMDIGAPEMIIRNEKRMLQEAVDVLISNGKRGRSVTGSNGRPLKSLGNIIEGKQGRFRQNLLGKRVDYSGRSVIVVGPQLKFHQVGLPKEMALELFKPFIIHELVSQDLVTNVKSAKRKIEHKEVVVWDVLDQVIKDQTVLINRAPTLHRLGIQSFEPILVEGSAIQVHPLVCTAFNADFDGDQMAVHVPLSVEAQAESRLLIMSVNNILSPSSGKAIITPSQDMVLGIYFLTVENPAHDGEKTPLFYDIDEAKRALECKRIRLQSKVIVRLDGERVETTMGRVLFNEAIWNILAENNVAREPFVNEVVGKKKLGQLILNWFRQYGNELTVLLADKLKDIGFHYSTMSGISISISDLVVPKIKADLLKKADDQVRVIDQLFSDGAISKEEKRLRSNDVWRATTQAISDALEDELGQLNNVFIMANSGARGNIDQVRQLAGMRGLMSDSQGRTIDIPIRTNFKEGLSLTEYFISAYGARKGLVDTALRTADSGYLTRRLVDVAQDVMITLEDCGTEEGVEVRVLKDGVNVVVPLSELVEGRFTIEDIKDPLTGKVIVKKDTLIDPETAIKIDEAGFDSVKLRGIFACKAKRGLCQKCYGQDLSSGKVINLGEAAGIIAAQSIGEPGTQLTMRTFHTGGVDLRKASKVDVLAKLDGTVHFPADMILTKIKEESGKSVWVSTVEGEVKVKSGKTETSYTIPVGARLFVKDGGAIKRGESIAEYDPAFEYLFSQSEGVVKFIHLETQELKDSKGNVTDVIAQSEGELFIYDASKTDNVDVKKAISDQFVVGDKIKSGEIAPGVVIERSGIIKDIKLTDKKEVQNKKVKGDVCTLVIQPGVTYPISELAKVYVKEGDKVVPGDILSLERLGGADSGKTKDIVQGLPRVEELFEARKPKDSAIISEFDGIAEISFEHDLRVITVHHDEGKKEYKVPPGLRLKVFSGKPVSKGDVLSDGVISPHDVLATKGVLETQRYLTEEVQKVYQSQGVQINSKHVEVIVRQMTRRVNVTDMGDSTLLPNELVDVHVFERINSELRAAGKLEAHGTRLLLGITRASLNTDSFISASSFQQTASVLTKAAIEGQTDPMLGLKENVIIGKLIPAGTGLHDYSRLTLDAVNDDVADGEAEAPESLLVEEFIDK